jgi:RNA polymerase sigma-70 factor (ECF subfamily)
MNGWRLGRREPRPKTRIGQRGADMPYNSRIPEDRTGPDRTRRAPEITRLLLAWGEGDRAALEELMPLVYDELKRLARRKMADERAAHTLQATALVGEAYVRLVEINRVRWQNRAHFLSMAARLMRRILVDAARARKYQKRGGGAQQVSLDEALLLDDPGRDLIALDDALGALAAVDERKSKVVEMRFFGGLTVEETAEALGVSNDTVMRDWKLAKAWLAKEIMRTG